MKKLTTSEIKTYKYFKLYKDDIKNIYKLFTGAKENITLNINNYTLDDIDEIDDIKNEVIKTLHIYDSDYSLSFSVSVFEMVGFLKLEDSNDSNMYGVFCKINKIIEGCVLKRLAILDKASTIAHVLLLTFAAWYLILYVIFDSTIVVYLLIFIPLLSIALLTLCLNSCLNSSKRQRLFLFERKERPGFFKKYKDKIILSIVVSTITFFITYFLSKLLN